MCHHVGMPIAFLKFDLAEEAIAHREAVNGPAAHRALSEYIERMRQETKHAELSEDEARTWERARTLFWECINDEGIQLEGW